MSDTPNDSDLIHAASAGDRSALAALWLQHRARLRQMIWLRLDRRLKSRVDPSDVLQDAFLDLADRLPDYARERPMPVFLWIRLVVRQRLLELHRRHLRTALRDARRETSLHRRAPADASTISLPGRFTPASQATLRAERRIGLQQALDAMEPCDREIIALRHFGELSNSEAAKVLGLSIFAASKRYLRALTRLQTVLKRAPAFARGDLN